MSVRAGWAAVASVAAASFTLVLSEFIVVAVLPDMVRQFDISAGTAGLTLVMPGAAGRTRGADVDTGVRRAGPAADSDYLLFAVPVLVAVALTLTLLTRLQHSDPGPAEPSRREPRDTPQPITPAPQPVRP
jgi:hypothetical protein